MALRIPYRKGSSRATGFFIAPEIVVTCAHAIEIEDDSDRLEIQAEAGSQQFVLRVTTEECFRSDDGLDVAMLRLAEGAGPEPDYVLGADGLATGDRLWTFGFPEGRYQGGKPASLVCEGFSRIRPAAELQLGRVSGIPIGPGYSGSPVLNRRTGAVCGMLCTSDLRGSAHLLPIADILKLSPDIRNAHQEPERHQRSWLDGLDDAQVRAGGWRYPGPALRSYLTLAARAAELHPYPGAVPGIVPPTLSEVYVHQEAWADSDSGHPYWEGQTLPARTVLEPPGSVVLIGGAGAGKSSLLRTAVATKVREWESGELIRWVPVRVQAADLVAAQPLPEAIADGVCDDLSALGLKQAWAAEMFAKPPFPDAEWLILVDGLDELMSTGQRRAVLTKLAGMYDQDKSLFRFVVATRPLASDESVIPSEWEQRCFELLPLTTSQFSEIAMNWFDWLELADPRSAAERFLAQVQERELVEVARNPLMATILCHLFAENPDASLPPGRSRIFDAFEELLNSRQYGSSAGGIRNQIVLALAPFGRTAEDAGERLLEQVPGLIRRLAWYRVNGDTAATIDLFNGWLSRLKPDHVPHAIWLDVLRDLLRRSGVLQERAGDFFFFHRTITEHLAAKFVADDGARSDTEFREFFKHDLWRETQSYARFLVAAWSNRPDLPGMLSGMLEKGGLAGARFVASLQMDGIELPTELYAGSLERLVSFAVDFKLPEPDRRAAAETILIGDKNAGISVLASAIRTRSLDASYRSWALETLAEIQNVLSPGPTRRSLENPLVHAMRQLVEHDDANGRDLIALVATDSTWPEREREWAAKALLEAGKPIADVLEPLIKSVRATYPDADVRLIDHAYDVAAYWHRGQKRKSGDPYITHPLAVATILAEWGMDTDAICAALLHDTVKNTPYTLVELRAEFGEDIATLVDSVTKLGDSAFQKAAEAGAAHKLVVAMSRDIRVPVIELACRLYDMRTIRYLVRGKQERKAQEVLEIYAPLAHRLCMNTIKWELEDLAFATLYPKRFDEIARLMSERAPRRDVFLQEVVEDVSADLREAEIKAGVTGRPKHCYSVYQKMIARNVGFDDIHDLVEVRVLVDSVRDCYAALGTVHARWNPVPGRFRDYIAMPKFNMYQALHTTVIGPGGKPVELQIRTWGMHRRTENGVAARWKYKEETMAGNARGSEATDDMPWLRQLVDWQRETADPAEVLESLRFDLGAAEVYVFTPRGEVIVLPQSATPVDFAYAIHTEVGHRTIGARVNGRLVALESALDNGNTVEISTSKAQDAGPSRDWLMFVKSARAQNTIQHWFSKERREVATETGKTAIVRALREHGLPLQRLVTGDALLTIAAELDCRDLSALYAAVGNGHVSAQSVAAKLVQLAGGMAGVQEDLAEAVVPTKPPFRPLGDPGVVVEGATDVWTRPSKCCTPVPGDEIGGFVTHRHGVSVHRNDCINFIHLAETQPERLDRGLIIASRRLRGKTVFFGSSVLLLAFSLSSTFGSSPLPV